MFKLIIKFLKITFKLLLAITDIIQLTIVWQFLKLNYFIRSSPLRQSQFVPEFHFFFFFFFLPDPTKEKRRSPSVSRQTSWSLHERSPERVNSWQTIPRQRHSFPGTREKICQADSSSSLFPRRPKKLALIYYTSLSFSLLLLHQISSSFSYPRS